MKQRLNILFIASWYPSRAHANLGNFVQRHAEAVSRHHKVCVITAAQAGYHDLELVDKGNLFEIKVYFKKKLPFFSYHMAIKKALAASQTYFPKPHLAHVHVVWPAGITALNLRLPYLVTEHFSGYHQSSKFRWGTFQRYLSKRILRKAEVILPVSQHLGSAIRKFGANTPQIKVSNVVDPRLFFPSKQLPDRFSFLHVSTLEERSKNISGILKGFRALEEQGHDFILKIGGDGDLRELQQKILSYGPSPDKVVIVEERPIDGIAALMRESHCLVMFSHFENQPCTILEALCSGLPVISSDVGGIPEEIHGDNGILIPAEDHDAFVAGLARMMNNYQSFDRAKIASSARQKYSYAAVAEKINELYTSVLRKAASGR